MNTGRSGKPVSRSRTPEPRRNREDAAARADAPATARADMRRPPSTSRGAKSENDLRKTTKSTETLSRADREALAYNAYLQSVLMSLHDAEVRQNQERETVSFMERQQFELIALDEERNFLAMALMKIRLFKEMKEKFEKKTELCTRLLESINERELDQQIETTEDIIMKTRLKNFKLPETNEDRNAVVDTLKKISELLDTIPEIKEIVEPVSTMNTSLVKAEELGDAIEKLKKECLKKMKQAETLLYDELFLETRVNQCAEQSHDDSQGSR